MTNKTTKLVITALMAAMTCIATMVIKFPTPTGGYIHVGDGLVLLSGIFLGPLYGGIAAGIGSMFADIFSGYMGFAAATLIIKALAAIAGSLVFHMINRKLTHSRFKNFAILAAGVSGGIIVTTGYFIFEAFILGLGSPAAFAGVPFNMVQNIFGIIVSALLLPILTKVPIIKEVIVPVN